MQPCFRDEDVAVIRSAGWPAMTKKASNVRRKALNLVIALSVLFSSPILLLVGGRDAASSQYPTF